MKLRIYGINNFTQKLDNRYQYNVQTLRKLQTKKYIVDEYI